MFSGRIDDELIVRYLRLLSLPIEAGKQTLSSIQCPSKYNERRFFRLPVGLARLLAHSCSGPMHLASLRTRLDQGHLLVCSFLGIGLVGFLCYQ